MVKKTKIKTYFRLLGILLTVVGWIIANLSEYPSIRKLLLPKYSIAISTLEKMNREGFILKKGDQGFPEISELFRHDMKTMKPAEIGDKIPEDLDRLRKIDDWKINKFETLKSEIGMIPTDKVVRRLTLKISSDNIPTQELLIADLKGWVESRYSKKILFRWGKYVFWTGIVISVISVFL